MKKECNCWLGTLNAYDQSGTNDLYLDSYIGTLRDKAELSSVMHDLSPNIFECVLKPKDYIDRRKSLATLFVYCPNCGGRINWTKLRSRL